MEKSSKTVNSFISIFANILMSLLVIIVFLQVLARYVFNYPLSWSEEISRYMMIWLTFLGAALAVEKDIHPRVTVLVDTLPGVFGTVLNVLGRTAGSLFYAILAYYGFRFASLNFNQPSMVMRFPMGYVFAVIPVSAVVLLLNNVLKTIECVREGRSK